MTLDYAAMAKDRDLRKALWSSRLVHKPTRASFLMASAADPILAMASAPFAPVQPAVSKAKRRRRK